MQLAIIVNHNSHGRYYMTMSKDKQNNGEKEIKCSAKLEIIYRITNEDGTVEECVASANVPGKCDMDFSTIESVKRSFSTYEKAVLEADNKLREEISNDHMREASKKRPSRRDNRTPVRD